MGEYFDIFGGVDVIKDPGGVQLLRRARTNNASDNSILQIREGTGVLVHIDGQWGVVTKSGRYTIPKTGIWTFFPALQNVVSKGKPTHFNEYFFFDLSPKVYRDIQFVVDELICIDAKTKLQVKCAPTVNVSVRIKDPLLFFKAFSSYDFSNEAVSKLMSNRVSPTVRAELYRRSKSKPIVDVNAESVRFQGDVDIILKDFLKDFGLEVNYAHVIKLGVAYDDLEHTRKYYEDIAEAQKINAIANALFNGNKEKAIKYVLMKAGISKDVGMNPILWKMMENYLNSN